uniref:MalT-like TPR region domain-containing protein n=1 Tax=Aegilops tauschii subsp. strangulata TaxID=200361 RepID=A0A453KLX0_AEGTS
MITVSNGECAPIKHGSFSCKQGKLDEAEKLFKAALQEAKEAFGLRDPHAASALNNLVCVTVDYELKIEITFYFPF